MNQGNNFKLGTILDGARYSLGWARSLNRMCLSLFVATAFASQAFAEKNELLQKLDREEKSWHKYFVFTMVASATGEDRLAAMEWLRDRLMTGTATDSRYAMTYSQLLWSSVNPALLDDAITFGVAGYLALQIESGRCETRNESIQVARQWYDSVRPQLMQYKSLPRAKKDAIFSVALEYATRLSSVAARASDPGSDWMCYLLPSYITRIIKLPDVIVETRKQNGFVLDFVSHPVVKPVISPERLFLERKNKIVDDMKGW
ncbi:MAG: hypothetical protein EPO06_05000 [Burkholderiaceae bacterium]|nr:MAG: hypothetical protein EPO06_05000 [Burkholderiaceae bacterium]